MSSGSEGVVASRRWRTVDMGGIVGDFRQEFRMENSEFRATARKGDYRKGARGIRAAHASYFLRNDQASGCSENRPPKSRRFLARLNSLATATRTRALSRFPSASY